MLKKLVALVFAGAISIGLASPAMAHEVKSGDTMSKIANSYELSLEELAGLNPQVKNINLIYVGQNINTIENESNAKTKVKVDTEVKVKEEAKTVSNSNSDVDLLARIIRAEAQGESFEGKVAVGEVVLNRVNSSQFPNTIKDVIYQSGQFSPVASGSINTPADAESLRASQEALKAGSNVGDALYFYNPSTASSRWLDGKPTKAVIGNHTFK